MLKFETRPEPSRVMSIASPLLALAITVVVGVALFAILGKDPVKGLQVFFVEPVRSVYALSELAMKVTPLLLIALGLSVCFRSNIWNIGAEGQFILGAVFATGIALQVGEQPAAWAVPAMVVAGAAGGALWAAIPAWLRTRFGTNEILVSLMLVYVAQLFASWLIHGPWKDPGGYNFPQTAAFGDSALLPLLIEGTRLNAGFLLALALLVAGHVFLQMSFQGFQLQVAGQAPDAGRYAGFSARRAIWVGMLAGGALSGIAGMTEVAGPMGQLTGQISAGYGFAAIIVAFVGRLQPLGVFFASLLMALLFLGGEQAQQQLNLPSSISKVFQGMLLFFLLACDLFIGYRLRFGRVARQGA